MNCASVNVMVLLPIEEDMCVYVTHEVVSVAVHVVSDVNRRLRERGR